MSSDETLASAVQVLTARAMEIRTAYAAYEQTTIGAEWTVGDLLNGFMVDVGDLTRLAMAKTGKRSQPDDLNEALSHELADCLWSVLVLAARLDVDLGAAFAETMDGLEHRLADRSIS